MESTLAELIFSEILTSSQWNKSLERFSKRVSKGWRFSSEASDDQLTLGDLQRNSGEFFSRFKKLVAARALDLGNGQETALFEKSGRIIYSFPVFETFVFDHVARLLKQNTKHLVRPSVCGYYAGSSDNDAVKIVRSQVLSRPEALWITRRDLSNYGRSIPHHQLILHLNKIFGGPSKLTSLLLSLLRFSYIDVAGNKVSNNCGGPTGTNFQVVLNNLYLTDIDERLEHFVDRYLRLGDDIILLDTDFMRASGAAATLDRSLEAKGLFINTDKSQGVVFFGQSQAPFHSKQTFEYLGRRMHSNGDVSVKREDFMTFRAAVDRLLRLSARLYLSQPEGRRVQLLCSAAREIFRNPHFTTSASAQMIDRNLISASLRAEFQLWLSLTVLKHAIGKGFKKANLRRYPPQMLIQFGLPRVACRPK